MLKGRAERLKRFLAKPAECKLESLTFRLRSLLPTPPPTIVLPFGAKWILTGSALDYGVHDRWFENAEISFVQRMLKTGMTVLDIGAYHGLYTLLASACIGPTGRVIAFEPSDRERAKLKRNVRLNSCPNVRVEGLALAGCTGKAEFFLVQGIEDFCNSLRPPAVDAKTQTVKVRTISLDEFLGRRKIAFVDFIKIDTEGAELEILRGARKLLSSRPRPVLLMEIAEIRTAPWGYPAREIIHFMKELEYVWFSVRLDGSLAELEPDHNLQDTNLVAVPNERREAVQFTIASASTDGPFKRS